MKQKLSMIFAATAWFAVVVQYVLMMENRIAPIGESTVRFFSFFTILTNLLVAVYFSYQAVRGQEKQKTVLDKPGSLTAITVYIAIVGLVYQVVLRQTWEPRGMQRVVDELLHSVTPLLVVVFWYLYEQKSQIQWQGIPKWLLFPLIYLIFILFRGHFSGFYPYPFMDVTELGLQQVLLNAVLLLVVFVTVSVIFVAIGKRLQRREKPFATP
ncbi:Pr6Pr family membrane protein [Pontibacter sp. 13R65]|uniref:Pr6Pr family membrane protein n=1 Tax=Pontibacter sp. 13R65 TaxID=3127458 RepID=UPI00301C17AB